MSGPLPVTLEDVRAARERIAPFLHRTPAMTSRRVDARTGARVVFKCETFQRVGAFKARGAFAKLTLVPEASRPRGAVAFSSGNHAQAVALAAATLGMPAVIVMPSDAPARKLAATRGYGARVVLYDRYSEDREAIARRLLEETGGTLVPPFDDPAVIAGQGTLALELLEEHPDLDVVITPCGGGGLLSGVCVAGKGMLPSLRLFGVEPEAGDDFRRSLEAGRPVSIGVPSTIADSLQTTRPGAHTFAIVSTLAEGILTVSDDDLRRAMAFVFEAMKLVVEPGGAAAFAALLAGRVPGAAGAKVGIVLSGGNVDPETYAEAIRQK